MRVQVVLVGEDEQLLCFARRFLKLHGFAAWQLREVKAPPGAGSGEQWVRERLPTELEAMRKAGSRAVIALTDADVMGVPARIAMLRAQCTRAGIKWRQPGEALLLIIPARNIETWLAYLRGEAVNEKDRYLKYAAEGDCRDQVRALVQMCQAGGLRATPPPSLVLACTEWSRLP